MRDFRILSQTARGQGRAWHMLHPSKKSEHPMDRSSQLPLAITVEEAATMLSIGRVTMYKLVRKRVVQSVRIEGTRRVIVSSVHDYLKRLIEYEGEGA
jgi:excisionase family DNA binding protein